MSKLWCIEVQREIEDKFVGHWERDTKPTEQEVIKWLSEVHCIDDDPDCCRYDIYLVKLTVGNDLQPLDQDTTTETAKAQPPSPSESTELEEILPCISCGSQADPADGFGNCTCGNEKLRYQIQAYIDTQVREATEQTANKAIEIVEDEYQKSRTIGRKDDAGGTRLFVEVTLRERIKTRLKDIGKSNG